MGDLSIDEMKEELDLEFYLDRESEPYKVTRGVNGVQLLMRNCPNPNCRDDRWRTYYGVESHLGNCFVCGQGFNGVSYIYNHMGASDWRSTFVVVEELLRDQGWRPKRKAQAVVVQGPMVLPVSDPLPRPDGTSIDYLTNRGFGPDICAYLGLRHCVFGGWMFTNPETGVREVQNFSNRIIIPVHDLDGSLVTFQGRDLTGTSNRKYLFPMEVAGTGRYLFNGQNVVATNHVVMNEGAFDVAATKLALDEDVALRHIVPVGSFGKHLSYGHETGDDQISRFRALKARGLEIVTIMWDGEEKALVSALDAAKKLTEIGLKTRIALLPFGKDPNEVVPSVVRDAFHKARLWTPTLDVTLRLMNPYRQGGKHFKS